MASPAYVEDVLDLIDAFEQVNTHFLEPMDHFSESIFLLLVITTIRKKRYLS